MQQMTTPEQTFAALVAEGDVVLDKLDECARTVPDKVFIHYGEDGIKLTFAEFKARTDRIAAGLVALGVTEGAAELGQDKILWLEANAAELNGVSFTKGCYVGQENTARMHYRAKVSRRLVAAPLGEPGDRTRASYAELRLMVEHRRVDALGDALIPSWLATALLEGAD